MAELTELLGRTFLTNGQVRHSPCWIKADPTYDGLLQTLFEPDNRVFIGDVPESLARVQQNSTRYIERVLIERHDPSNTAVDIWFDGIDVPLNPELVAIIGNKGNGKSALADTIGLVANSHNQVSRGLDGSKQVELFSFLSRDKFHRGGLSKRFIGSLRWCNARSESKNLDEATQLSLPQRVEYLPQKYLERICADLADDEFRITLNQVIFRYVPTKDQHGRQSLEELIDYRGQQSKSDISRLSGELAFACQELADVDRRLTDEYKSEIEERRHLKQVEIAAHDETQPLKVAAPPEKEVLLAGNKDVLEQLDKKTQSIQDEIAAKEGIQRRTADLLEELQQLRTAIDREVTSLQGIESRYQESLRTAGLKFQELVSVKLDTSKLDDAIATSNDTLRELRAALEEPALDDDWPEAADESDIETISLPSQLARLTSERAKVVDTLDKPAREFQQYVVAQKEWQERRRQLVGDGDNANRETLQWLEGELLRIGSQFPADREKAFATVARHARDIFEKKRALTLLYNDIKREIDAEINRSGGELIDYKISIDAGLRLDSGFADDFLRFVNQSIVGSFKGQDDGKELIDTLMSEVADWSELDQVFLVLAQITEALRFDKRKDGGSGKPTNPFKQLKGKTNLADVYHFLYSFGYLETKYDLRVDGKNLSELSPGERGGLLLVFYLMLDKQEIPLIIDQPEDNLDNRSVYETLVTFIRAAKRRRQIILVTHNPNLAVGADAEQIIQVTLDKRDGRNEFSFVSGSIENEVIRSSVVDTLEGTRPAFDYRRVKYRRPKVLPE